MIALHAWPTPNGQKVSIMLEECGLPYEVVAVDINQGAQFAPDFLAISPNNRIPAIVDDEGPADDPGGAPMALFESGAILQYLAEKTGRFLPADGQARYRVMEWLMFQMAGLGPMCGQAHHFRQAMGGEEVPYGIAPYTKEVGRLYRVMDTRLGACRYLPARPIRSPTSRVGRGSARTAARARTWPISRRCAAGSRKSAPGPRSSAACSSWPSTAAGARSPRKPARPCSAPPSSTRARGKRGHSTLLISIPGV